MNTDVETPMAALFEHLKAAASIAFTADATEDSAVLENVSDLDGLFAGLPVFGQAVSAGAKILEVDAQAATVTLTMPLTASGAGGEFVTGFLTAGRRVLHWSQVANQPALFLRRTGMLDEYAHDNSFGMTTIEGEAWIYSNAGQDPDAAPDATLTGLERRLRESFAPDADYGDPRFTLGGLVYWCRIEGKSDISPGDQGPQAIARIPIRITLP